MRGLLCFHLCFFGSGCIAFFVEIAFRRPCYGQNKYPEIINYLFNQPFFCSGVLALSAFGGKFCVWVYF